MNKKNKVRLILLTFILVLTISNSNITNVSAVPLQVIFVNAGAGAGGELTTLSVPYSVSGIQAGDLLFCQVVILVTTVSLTSVSGFSSLLGPYTAGTDSRTWVYYRYATGSESGSVTVTRAAGTAGMIARIYQFRNTAQIIGDAYEAVNWANLGSVSTILDTGVTTSGTLELAVNLVTVGEDANTYISFTSETGGDWTESIAQYSNAAGNDGTIQIQCATMATSGTINGGSYAMGAADPAGVLGFALKPEVSAGEEFTANIYEGISVSDNEYSSSDYLVRYYDSILNNGQVYTSVEYVLGLYDDITLQSNTIYSLVLSKLIFEVFTVVTDALLSIDFALIFSDIARLSSSVILTVSFFIQFFESFAIVSTIAVSLAFPELVYLFESIHIYDTTFYYAGAVTLVNIAENIAVELLLTRGDLMTDIFYSLFLSLEMWGYFGPLALVIIGYYITKKENGLGIFFIIVDSLIIYMYLALVEATPQYWWHVFILILGVIQCTFRLASR